MYKMISEYGNAIYYVDTESERQRFLRLGFSEEKPETAKGVKRNVKTKKDKN